MQKKSFLTQRLQRDIFDAINSCRAGVLDTFHLELGEAKNWKFIRSRLLNSFGQNGLTGRISEILEAEINSNDELNSSSDVRGIFGGSQ